MPQMSPMNWLILFMFFSVCYSLVIVKISSTKLIKFGQSVGSDFKKQGFNLMI